MTQKELDNAYDRARFRVDIENMSFREIIDSLEPGKDGRRFLAIVIDNLNHKAKKEGVRLYDFLKIKFNEEPSNLSNKFDETQGAIQKVEWLKK